MKKAGRSFEGMIYNEFKYIPVSPLEHNVHCLDVVTKVVKPWPQRVRSMFSSNIPHFAAQGSMLDVDLMAEESKWRSADSEDDLDSMRRGLAELEHPLKPTPSLPNFQKKKLPESNLSFSASRTGSLWLASVAGIALGKDESLSCKMEGLTAASVDHKKIREWITAGDWTPNQPIFQMNSSDWSKNAGSEVQKLWIVTEVLYATKLTLTGRRGLFDKVMAHATASAPGVGVDAGADFMIQVTGETRLQLKAKRNKHFIVGYKTMRVEYGPDGQPAKLRSAEEGGLRGDDDDRLAEMVEDIFELDEDGIKVFVPLVQNVKQDSWSVDSRGSNQQGG